MNSSDDDELISERLPTMQIIQDAIVSGALIFAVVAFIMRQGGVVQGGAQPPIISYVISGLAVMSLIQWPIVTRIVVKESRKRSVAEGRSEDRPEVKGVSDTAKLLAVYQTQMIVGAAILEGATFALIISYMIDGTSWTLVGALVLCGVNALQFPTPNRVERWLGEQLELMEQERAGAA